MFSHSKILFLVPLLFVTSIPTYFFKFLIILITNKTEHFSFKGGHAMQVAKYTVGTDCHVSDNDVK